MVPGRLITLEGIDGAGKSSQVATVVDWIRARGRICRVSREPGGTSLGEALRNLVLTAAMTAETETLLMFAARREHLVAVIEPALAAGEWVVSDRFTDASFAYQGGGRGVETRHLEALENWLCRDTRPELTLWFDIEPAVAAQRLRHSGATPDRFESEREGFFERVRGAYQRRAAAEPLRIQRLDAGLPPETVRGNLEAILAQRLGSVL